VQENKVKKLKKNEQERDFLCVVSDAFRVFARRSSMMLGSAWAFAGAALVICVWILTGPTFHFSDTWQLIINTATTVITFLMVFLIQNTQNRDAKAMHLKLDEIIRALKAHEISLSILKISPTKTSRNSKSNFDDYERKRNATGRGPATRNRRRPARTNASISLAFLRLACSQKKLAAGT
jgi:low affinity Fe/Cu permease